MDAIIIKKSKKAEEMNNEDFAKYIKSNALDYLIVGNMRQFAGGFVKALAECILLADSANYTKLVNTFREYFNQYLPHHWGIPNGKN